MKLLIPVFLCCSLLVAQQISPQSEIEYWRARALQAEALVSAYRLSQDLEQKRRELAEQCGRDKQLTDDPRSGRPVCIGLPQPPKKETK